MIGFKELVEADNLKVFINPEEFGEVHDINGKKCHIVIDDYEMIEREKRIRNQTASRDGIFKKQLLFYVAAKEFGPLPPVGYILKLDNKSYVITDSVNEDGIYSISIEMMRAK